MTSFTSQVKTWSKKTESKLDLAARKISLELFSRVILRSPVDTGRFRGNWQVQIGTIPRGTLEIEDKAGTATVNKADAATAGIEAGDVIYLVNNLPYGLRLEDGYSGQAPAGMVGLSVQEFRRIAKEVGFELVKI